jgi:hypothetical protein
MYHDLVKAVGLLIFVALTYGFTCYMAEVALKSETTKIIAFSHCIEDGYTPAACAVAIHL